MIVCYFRKVLKKDGDEKEDKGGREEGNVARTLELGVKVEGK